MPRDGSGLYTLPSGVNPVVDNTIIASTWANPTMADVAVQLNNVVTRDGVLPVNQPFRLIDGTAAAPALAFINATGTGLFRDANGMYLDYQGAARFRLDQNGLESLLPAAQFAGTGITPGTPAFANAAQPTTGMWFNSGAEVDFSISGTNVFAIKAALVQSTQAIAAPNYQINTMLATDAGSFGFTNGLGSGMITWGNSTVGAGKTQFTTAGASQLEIPASAGAVNFLQGSGATTGNAPNFGVNGADTNIGWQLLTKGAGLFTFFGQQGASPQLQIGGINASTRYLTIKGSVANDPILSAGGTNYIEFAATPYITSGSAPRISGASGSYLNAGALTFFDSSRPANGRLTEFLGGNGSIYSRFISDNYALATEWVRASGNHLSVSSIQFTTGASGTNGLYLAGIAGTMPGMSIGGTAGSIPFGQLAVTGLNQVATPNLTDAGAFGASIFLKDTGVGGAGAGGCVYFAAFGSNLPFGAVKGYITDASGNGRGDIVMYNRRVATDAFLKENFHFVTDGSIYGTALHNNSAAWSQSAAFNYIGSGNAIFVPAATALTGTCTAVNTFSTALWSRSGGVVTVSGQCNVTTNAGGTFGFDLTVPLSSQLLVNGDAFGVLLSNGVGSFLMNAGIAQNGAGRVRIGGQAASGTTVTCFYQYQYYVY